MAKVCIIYGFCEGPRMAAPMLDALKGAGHSLVRDPYAADVVFAHSGGCFLVPSDMQARQIIMVGLVHWPGRSVISALVRKNVNDFKRHRRDRKTGRWLHKFRWNAVYFWNMQHNIAMLRARTRGDFWRAEHLTLVRNTDDTLCTPNLAGLPFVHEPHLIELPDQYDDIWLHPERYIAVIQ